MTFFPDNAFLSRLENGTNDRKFPAGRQRAIRPPAAISGLPLPSESLEKGESLGGQWGELGVQADKSETAARLPVWAAT